MSITEKEKERFKDWAKWYRVSSPCNLCVMKNICHKANSSDVRSLYRVFTVCPLGKNLMQKGVGRT